VARQLNELSASARADAAAGRPVQLLDGAQVLTLQPDEIDVRLEAKEGFATGAGGGMVVAIDTTVTPELRAEGLAREVVSRCQGMRKQLGLPFEARIVTTIDAGGELGAAVEQHQELIAGETLSVEIRLGECDGDLLGEFTVDEFEMNIGIREAGKKRRKKPAKKKAKKKAKRKPAKKKAAKKAKKKPKRKAAKKKAKKKPAKKKRKAAKKKAKKKPARRKRKAKKRARR
jgi:flagellar biosynthesis GTPase FlhF